MKAMKPVRSFEERTDPQHLSEGERAYDGELHQFKKGAAILATELELADPPGCIGRTLQSLGPTLDADPSGKES
jgi:hypothetical protein